MAKTLSAFFDDAIQEDVKSPLLPFESARGLRPTGRQEVHVDTLCSSSLHQMAMVTDVLFGAVTSGTCSVCLVFIQDSVHRIDLGIPAR